MSDSADSDRFNFPDGIRIWFHGPRPEYKLMTHVHDEAYVKYCLPHRALALMRPAIDLIFLPRGHAESQSAAEWYVNTLKLKPSQIIWTSGQHFLMEDDLEEWHFATIRQHLDELMELQGQEIKFTRILFIPYSATPSTWALVDSLRNFLHRYPEFQCLEVDVMGDSSEWTEQCGHKDILHRHVRRLDELAVVERYPSLVEVLRTPRGYRCSDVDDLLKAYDLLDSQGVVVKPVLGASGEGVLFFSNREDLVRYDFSMGEVLLEERLVIDTVKDEYSQRFEEVSPAVHYAGDRVVGGLLDQLMDGPSYCGWRPSTVSEDFRREALTMVHGLLNAFRPKGPGGFDFLSVGGKPYLTDINCGRFNGGHYPKVFIERWMASRPLVSFRSIIYDAPASKCNDLPLFWEECRTLGIASEVPGQNGVFPLLFLKSIAVQLIIFGNDEKHVSDIGHAASQCLFHLR
jgi:hypothetical protein